MGQCCHQSSNLLCRPAHLIRVGDVGAAVAGVSHAVSVLVQLVSVLDTLAVVQNVLQACWRYDDSVVWSLAILNVAVNILGEFQP